MMPKKDIQRKICGGSSSNTVKFNTGKFWNYFVDGTGTSIEGFYFRTYLSTAAASGECLRAYATVNEVACATVMGIHASLSFGAAGSVTGLGAAVRGTLALPTGGAWSSPGTGTAIMAEINGGASSDVNQKVSAFRVAFSGTTTNLGASTFLDLGETSAGSGATYFIDTGKTAHTGYGSLRVLCPDGAIRYLVVCTGS